MTLVEWLSIATLATSSLTLLLVVADRFRRRGLFLSDKPIRYKSMVSGGYEFVVSPRKSFGKMEGVAGDPPKAPGVGDVFETAPIRTVRVHND